MLTAKSGLARHIAGEVTLADNCSDCLRKWREVFGLNQTELAGRLNVTSSVISDYESGRRSSPGTKFVKHWVNALIELDEEAGGQVMEKLIVNPQSEAILELRELVTPVSAAKFIKLVDGQVIANKVLLAKRQVRGYTVLDSISAILNLTERQFHTIYGDSTERALIFTKVKLGRSPMIAIKVTQPKPQMIVLHGLTPGKVDKLGRHIAEREHIPLVVSKIKTEAELIDRLRRNLT
jgi:putative transcriptional regulator